MYHFLIYLVEELLDLADDPADPVEALVGEAAALELAEAVLEEGEGTAEMGQMLKSRLPISQTRSLDLYTGFC